MRTCFEALAQNREASRRGASAKKLALVFFKNRLLQRSLFGWNVFMDVQVSAVVGFSLFYFLETSPSVTADG